MFLLSPVAKTWLNPADLTITSGNFVSDGYSRDDRAYHLRRTATDGKLEFKLQSSDGSATVNPAFVIDGWGDGNLSLKMNGKQMAEGKNLRVGHLDTLDGTTLIVWIQGQISSPASFSFTLKR
ncbi:MAG TPA: hypothetical protein VN684_06420 [Terriglobales bacterium]|nr:hypothetical protein [Terriglobales bacterium]